MSDLLGSTALSSTMVQPAPREIFTTDEILAMRTAPAETFLPADCVNLSLLYNPFEKESLERHELEWREEAVLADYLEGLPEEAEWLVFLNGKEIELAEAKDVRVELGDHIGLVMVPLGGKTMKSILRIVAVAAAMVVGYIIGGPVGAIIAAAVVAIGMVLMAPKPPKAAKNDETRSYGIDGAKNSATEGIVFPVIYGEYRVAGNFSDTFTQNVGDDQFLYLRTILNDGQIEGVYDVEINEQPIATFKQVEGRYQLGTLDQQPDDWFLVSTIQHNKSIKLDTDWTSHITTEPVDKVRFDVTFTQGLVNIDEKKGKYSNRSVTFQTRYRPVNAQGVATGNGSWSDLKNIAPAIERDANGDGQVSFVENFAYAARVKIAAKAATKETVTGPTPAVQYRPVGQSNWSTAGDYGAEHGRDSGYAFKQSQANLSAGGFGNEVSIEGPTDITPYINNGFEIDLPAGNYEFRGVNGAEVTGFSAYPVGGTGTFTVTDKRTRQIRKTFESVRLQKGLYEVSIRRTTTTSTDQYKLDETFLTDVGEIEMEPVSMRGTATLSLRIKLNEQLNQLPSLTARVKGCILQEYDIHGNPTVKRWSANPAWIGLDMLCGIERGAGLPLSRIHWPTWVEFAEYCDANGITFNGVFDAETNLGDALRQVLRIGHAAPIPFGTKISVSIDRPRNPTAVFTQAQIIEKSFAVTYLPMANRANEFEVSYFDKTDKNKQKTIRYVDPKAVAFNEIQRPAQVTLMGVDNLDQAKKELWRMIYGNRLLMRTISFDALMDSINCVIGDVAIIHHSMMDWAESGLTGEGSTANVVRLDQKVEMEAGQSYSTLVHFDKLDRGASSVHNIIGKRVLIPTSSISNSANAEKVMRMTFGASEDHEVLSVVKGATYDTVTLATTPTGLTAGAQVMFWQTDAIEERAVSSVSQHADGTSSVTLASNLPSAPSALSGFVFGKVSLVKKPYTLIGIAGNGIEQRKLQFVEYHEGVYGPAEVEVPIPTTSLSDRQISHVQTLLFDYDSLVKANTKLINARVHWNAGSILHYAGADVYMAINGGEFRSIGSALNSSEMLVQVAPDDQIEFKVVAYNKRGDRAPFATAPGVAGTIAVTFATLNEPTGFTAETIAFSVDGKARFGWDEAADRTGIQNYEVQYKRQVDAAWTSLGHTRSPSTAGVRLTSEVAGLPTGTYNARVRAISDTSTSVWATASFTVVVVPGSLMANFNSSNDRNGTAIPAPTLPVTPVQHSLNKDGTANVQFDWTWGGDEATIDGFIVTVENTPPA